METPCASTEQRLTAKYCIRNCIPNLVNFSPRCITTKTQTHGLQGWYAKNCYINDYQEDCMIVTILQMNALWALLSNHHTTTWIAWSAICLRFRTLFSSGWLGHCLMLESEHAVSTQTEREVWEKREIGDLVDRFSWTLPDFTIDLNPSSRTTATYSPHSAAPTGAGSHARDNRQQPATGAGFTKPLRLTKARLSD